mmetsp:Transcript_21130/g.39654  ORF Transcript_21130/g.39654 Transcript_21130/m.39654 type:complete len:256 (+) Transcript_21130:186-953(+)
MGMLVSRALLGPILVSSPRMVSTIRSLSDERGLSKRYVRSWKQRGRGDNSGSPTVGGSRSKRRGPRDSPPLHVPRRTSDVAPRLRRRSSTSIGRTKKAIHSTTTTCWASPPMHQPRRSRKHIVASPSRSTRIVRRASSVRLRSTCLGTSRKPSTRWWTTRRERSMTSMGQRPCSTGKITTACFLPRTKNHQRPVVAGDPNLRGSSNAAPLMSSRRFWARATCTATSAPTLCLAGGTTMIIFKHPCIRMCPHVCVR